LNKGVLKFNSSCYLLLSPENCLWN